MSDLSHAREKWFGQNINYKRDLECISIVSDLGIYGLTGP